MNSRKEIWIAFALALYGVILAAWQWIEPHDEKPASDKPFVR